MALHHIKRPMLFQGKGKIREYFEGWYYKQGSKDGKAVVALIPGVSLAERDEHCFVQSISMRLDKDGNHIVNTSYYKYPLREFSYRDDPFIIKIADNYFTESLVSVMLRDGNSGIEGTLILDDLTPIKTSLLMPNIMGYFAYFPKMECYHGVISMNHKVYGVLKVDGHKINFDGGNGYLEKDWGTSFPKKYIWIQCNQFKSKKVSIFCSIAHIPFMGSSFLGFICNIVIGANEYRFATYNRSKLEIIKADENVVVLQLTSNKAELRIEARLNNRGKLISPRIGKMQDTIKEGLTGTVQITLQSIDHKLIYEGWSHLAGIEIVGFV
ncbi:MAG: hypothetical protein K0Q48_1425 [Bacillota bacterium]|nr:hypothetical protein [Bacillota bacterium]